MNQQTLSSPREHHFYVAIAKFLFHHPEYGIVIVEDPIKVKDAEQYGLCPLILYGLTVAGLPIRWMTFASIDQPKPFREILLEAWRNADGLRGRPNTLRINRHLAMACPELIQDMAKVNVQVVVADAKEKSLPGSLRSAQDSSRWLLSKHEKKDITLAGSIQNLCKKSQDNHNYQINNDRKGINSRKAEAQIQQWLALPIQQGPIPTLSGGMNWEAGPWLAYWESSLPPNPPRYFSFENFDGNTWLLTGEDTPEALGKDDNFWDNNDDDLPNIVKNLVACWPNPPAEIARCLGITLRELQWFISGKTTLDRRIRSELKYLLNIEFDERIGEYRAFGPYVLMARTPKALKQIYENISEGGNAAPYEIIPLQGIADPSWRYVLINTYDEPSSIVMSPRGTKITESLPDLLMNYDGVTSVPLNFYRDVVSTCALACRAPEANSREMRDFVGRWIKLE